MVECIIRELFLSYCITVTVLLSVHCVTLLTFIRSVRRRIAKIDTVNRNSSQGPDKIYCISFDINKEEGRKSTKLITQNRKNKLTKKVHVKRKRSLYR
jgi:hypothetical protein